MSLHFQAALGRKEPDEMRGQRMFISASGEKFAEITEFFPLSRVQRAETDGFARQRRDPTTGEHVYGKVDGDGPAMEKVQGPDVHGPAGQVHTAGRKSSERMIVGRLAAGQKLFRKESRHFAKFRVAGLDELIAGLFFQFTEMPR